MVAKHCEVNSTPEQLLHALGLDEVLDGTHELMRAIKFLGLKGRQANMVWPRLSKISWPSIAELNNGQFVVVMRADSEKIIIFDPMRPQSSLACTRDDFLSVWDGKIILIKGAASGGKDAQIFGFRWFIPEIKKYQAILREIFIAAFAIQIFGLAAPLFSQIIIDKVVVHRNLSTLHVLGIGMLILILFEAILTVLQNYLMTHTASRIDVVLGSRVVRHLLRLPLRFFENRRIGTIVAHVRELETVRQFITGSSIGSMLDLLSIIILVPLMFFYSSRLAWLVLATLPLFVASSLAIVPMMRRRLDVKFRLGAENQSFLVEGVSGIHTIKALAIEPIMERRWNHILSQYVTASYRASLLGGIGGALGQFIQKCAALAILWSGAEAVLAGDLSVGQLIAFQMLSTRIIQPIVRIAQLWQEFQQVALSVARIGDIMNQEQEPRQAAGLSGLGQLRGDVRLDELCFRYDERGPLTLNHLSLSVCAGQTVGIVGRSGSGKSTLTKLLQRLYFPESGKISIDGTDIRFIDPAYLRSQIGIVLQENFLFNGTIGSNIAINQPRAALDKIVHAATIAGAHEFISGLPNGYDTLVGERGVSLSGGQRQRVAIARALMGNPRILIFDEATSALDYESERIIQNNLGQICQGRTVFIIAHRLSTVAHADTILVLDRGAMVEQGSHRALLEQGGLYAHLFSQQEEFA
ncbi:peptidase domain-containing ABC transporter [Janthinobacterium sp. PAMC25594]|uniref:peptidase domain-containing ABC transporter n=1 Tax=Janthinobacterium sp. PAMC25594 TaxID=2861284 RepID=UPI002158C712|nr:type I secretion system permease/ATPase [Janthinobacterium sp. PAMC25594]